MTKVGNTRSTEETSRLATEGLRTSRARLAATAAFLGVLFSLHLIPRPARPYLVPLPAFEGSALERAARAESDAAASVHSKPLPHVIRVIGEEYRREGLRATRGGPPTDFAADVHVALQKGLASELLRLRSLQCELFMSQLRDFRPEAPAPEALLELGGDFALVAADSWWKSGGLLLNPGELRVLFRVRWAKMSGTLEHPELGPSLSELRTYHSAMLRHPPHGLLATSPELALARIQIVAELARIDPLYPAALALGLEHLRLGELDIARSALREALTAPNAAANSLRLRNHAVLAGVYARAPEGEP